MESKKPDLPPVISVSEILRPIFSIGIKSRVNEEKQEADCQNEADGAY